MRHETDKSGVILLALVAVGFVAAGLVKMQGCAPNYSTGTRAGTINKLSHKGIIWQSWEGSMVLGGMKAGTSGGVANVWDFSTTDDALALELQAALDKGEPVEVWYNEWLVGPWRISTTHEAKQIVRK